ncbi:MAG: class I SAM-dependent methyltransferase [Bacteroidia bacterium]
MSIYKTFRKFIFRTAISTIYKIRSILKLLQGYYIVNPYGKWWSVFPSHRMKIALEEIIQVSNIQLPFEKLIEHGCGNGFHYSKMLKQFTTHLIGVDIVEKEAVQNVDDYIKVSTNLQDEYFKTIESNSIDAVVILASVGINLNAIADKPHKAQWVEYLLDYTSRQGRYFSSANYLRLLKPGGYLIVLEWEAFPELRFGKNVNSKQVALTIDKYYPHPEIEQFQLIAKGFSSEKIGPYIVYKKLT